ncbi:MAG: FG-GAP repeat domain-containing protein [Candidatus Eisenbacteria bacterium]|nr:VCBS repeat-containing protein [Candidatus Eisenbacteria bacterium]
MHRRVPSHRVAFALPLLLALACAVAAAGPPSSLRTSAPPAGDAVEGASAVTLTAAGSPPAGESPPARGWPVNLHAPGAGFPYTPTLADVDGDGAAEIFLTGGDTFGLRGDGTFLPGWPTTEQSAMGYGTNDQKPGPSVADLEGDGDVEVLWSERDWYYGAIMMWCWNGREANGSNIGAFPQHAIDDYSNALDVPFVLADPDGDGTMEAWGPHSLGNAFVHYRISAFDAQGNRRFTRDLPSTQNIVNLHYGDVDGNGTEEFFALTWEAPNLRLYLFDADGGTLPGYPVLLASFATGYLCFGPPVVIDMDDDGDLEFVIGLVSGTMSRAYAQHHDGTPVAGYPIVVAYSSQLYYLGAGDLTGDGVPELLALENYLPGTNRAFAYRMSDGAVLAGWPVFIDDWPHGYPCVADVDGDGRQDFCLSTDGGEVYAIAYDGSILPGFPKTMVGGSISSVAAGDIDGDGLFELVSSTWDGWVYAWDTTGPALPGRADWPMRGIDARNTGVFRRYDPADVAGPLPFGAGPLRIAPNPIRPGAPIRIAGAPEGTTLEVLDVTGRHIDSVLLRSGQGVWQRGGRLAPGVYLLRPGQGPGGVASPAPGRFVVLD